MTLDDVTVAADTSTTVESAPANVTKPSKLPSPDDPLQIEVSVALATSAATLAITKSENNGGNRKR